MADAQIAIIDGDQTQVVLAPGENPAIVSSIPGPQGPAGAGVPLGGTTNQVLFKQSGTNYDTAWGPITSAMIGDLQIVNADVSASAAIAGTKISPDFGSQNVTTTGTSTAASFIPSSSTVPTNGIYLQAANTVSVATNSTERLRIDTTGQIEAVSLGTAAAPTFSFTGDPNTGIYSPGADQLALSTNGTGRLFVDSSGKVFIDSVTDNLIGTNTADGSDIKSLTFAATNAAVVSRGAFLSVYGNEHATLPGHCYLITGNQPGAELRLAATSTTGFVSAHVNGTERLRITSAGRVGVGTSVPSAGLTVSGDAATTAHGIHILRNGYAAIGRFGYQSASGSELWLTNNYNPTTGTADSGEGGSLNFASNGETRFLTTNTERARIDSSGRLLVGTPSARANFFNTTLATQLQLEGTTAANSSFSITRNSADADACNIVLGKTRSASVGGNTIINSGDQIGQIGFHGSDGTELVVAATIRGEVDGTPGANDMPGRLVFSTTADGAASPTERMRITSAGTTTLTSAASTAPFIANIGASEVARIDSSGRLLVGTSSATNHADNDTRISVVKAGAGVYPNITLTAYSGFDSGPAPYLLLQRSKSSSEGGFTEVSQNDAVGYILFKGADGAGWSEAAYISANADGDWTTGGDTTDSPGRLVFATTADGASSPTERLRITSAGVLQIADAGNISVGTTTGTKIGTATTQKLGFYNKTPVVQPAAVADATDAASVITQLNALLARMRDLGLIAT